MKGRMLVVIGINLLAGLPLIAQPQSYYSGSDITGQLTLTGTVNALQEAQRGQPVNSVASLSAEIPRKVLPKRLHPPVSQRNSALAANPQLRKLTTTHILSVNPARDFGAGFPGMTHAQQRLANGGNQFSVEPPSPGIAVGNGFLVEGVNNAFQVYSLTGAPLLTVVISTNQLFGLPAAIDRATGANGVFLTDMRVFYDQQINRWFVLQRAQDNDLFGNSLPQSHLYIAVSQTGDPTGTYNIYTMDTTNSQNFSCPCIADYPQVGADQYGLYISVNEFNAYFSYFADAAILAISKSALAFGVRSPTAVRFVIPFTTGYEFAIQPASIPPGAGYYSARGGVEFFLSSQASFSFDNNLALWAMTNTGSLMTSNPNPQLIQTVVPVLSYTFPDLAVQRPGPLPLGSSMSPPGVLEVLDGGDSRILSLVYANGLLYTAFATQVFGPDLRSYVSFAYVLLEPRFVAGALTGSLERQGYIIAREAHLLRPSVAVDSKGKGAIVCTLVGREYYPSAAFIDFKTYSVGSVARIAAMGAFPEDGFSGYTFPGLQGVARWGDYSAAVTAANGAIWMAAEYIPNAPRTPLANWGTFLFSFRPGL